MLLVSDSVERYFADPASGVPAWSRSPRFPSTMRATFPAVEGRPTIVIGTPRGTGLPPERWELTVAHEHFHQFQYSRPDYYSRLNALGLAHGDTTGMWALQFPFPYDSAPVQAAVRRWAGALRDALMASPTRREDARARVREARRALDALLAPEERRYLDFQLWQEGVPRWIELAVARAAVGEGTLPHAALAWQEDRLVNALQGLDLGRDRREVVYPLGAALAELLDREGSAWKTRYFERMFVLDD
jgi:hypothetical protein